MLKNHVTRHYVVNINRSFRKTFVMKLKHADDSIEMYDLENWKIYAEIRTRPPEAKQIVLFRTEINVANSSITIFLLPEDTANIVEPQGEYDIVLVDSLGESQTYLAGNITFSKTVTKLPSAGTGIL